MEICPAKLSMHVVERWWPIADPTLIDVSFFRGTQNLVNLSALEHVNNNLVINQPSDNLSEGTIPKFLSSLFAFRLTGLVEGASKPAFVGSRGARVLPAYQAFRNTSTNEREELTCLAAAAAMPLCRTCSRRFQHKSALKRDSSVGCARSGNFCPTF
jgi:hypothetical protein